MTISDSSIYFIRSKSTGLFRVTAPCDCGEHTEDHLRFTHDASEAAWVMADDIPDAQFLAERGLELVEVA